MANADRVVNVYIDGYNFYCSISSPDNADLKLGWCNFQTLGKNLAQRVFPDHRLGVVKYFTARVPEILQTRTGETDRQAIWLDALRIATAGEVRIVEGYWQGDKKQTRVEKQTDIRLAVSMLRDALIEPSDPRVDWKASDVDDLVAPCDATILISADKDFLPALDMISQYRKDVAVFITCGNEEWAGTRIHQTKLTKQDLQDAKLPDAIPTTGQTITWDDYLERRKDSQQRHNSSPYQRDAGADCVWLRQCRDISKQSPDPDTKVGCVIVGPDGRRISRACNDIPDGVLGPESLARPDKYDWLEHAERNAIYAAAKHGKRLQGCTMYVDLQPCVECARAIVQAGIREVVVSQQQSALYTGGKAEKLETARAILREAGIILRVA